MINFSVTTVILLISKWPKKDDLINNLLKPNFANFTSTLSNILRMMNQAQSTSYLKSRYRNLQEVNLTKQPFSNLLAWSGKFNIIPTQDFSEWSVSLKQL